MIVLVLIAGAFALLAGFHLRGALRSARTYLRIVRALPLSADVKPGLVKVTGTIVGESKALRAGPEGRPCVYAEVSAVFLEKRKTSTARLGEARRIHRGSASVEDASRNAVALDLEYVRTATTRSETLDEFKLTDAQRQWCPGIPKAARAVKLESSVIESGALVTIVGELRVSEQPPAGAYREGTPPTSRVLGGSANGVLLVGEGPERALRSASFWPVAVLSLTAGLGLAVVALLVSLSLVSG